MAVAPLFVPSFEELRMQLGLDDVSEDDVLEAIDRAILQARVDLYRDLGESLVTTLAAESHTDAPTTTAQLNRTRAELLERKMVRLVLLRELPVVFTVAQSDAHQEWNEHALEGDEDRLRSMIRSLEAQIAAEIADLTSDDDDGAVQGGTIAPDTTPAKVGTSLGRYSGSNRPYGNSPGPC